MCSQNCQLLSPKRSDVWAFLLNAICLLSPPLASWSFPYLVNFSSVDSWVLDVFTLPICLYNPPDWRKGLFVPHPLQWIQFRRKLLLLGKAKRYLSFRNSGTTLVKFESGIADLIHSFIFISRLQLDLAQLWSLIFSLIKDGVFI